MNIFIRKARKSDIDRIMPVYEKARAFMRKTGNTTQWVNGYPQRELIEQDIETGQFFVCCDSAENLCGCFAFVAGPDPTYSYIEDGQWSWDESYMVIHRLASDGSVQGVADACFSWCLEQHPFLRADTHADNKVMQHILVKNGFIRNGIIYVADGTPRIAYSLKRVDNMMER